MPIPEEGGNSRHGLSRRAFVRGSALTSAGAAMIDTASARFGGFIADRTDHDLWDACKPLHTR
jgi:hypothetical protein